MEYDSKLIQELENRYPGPYTVYRVDSIDKVGCTRNLEERTRQMKNMYGESLSLPKVIFETMSLVMAAEKERETKAQYGIPSNNTDYVNDLKRQVVSCRKEVRKKAVANTDHKRKWTIDRKKRAAEAKKEVAVAIIASKVLEVQWIGIRGKSGSKKTIKKTKYFRTFKSQSAASKYFNKKGLNISAQDIYQILNPNFGMITRHGYTFKKA